MRNTILIFFFLSTPLLSSGQLLKLSSKDSLNNKPAREFYITTWLKLNGIMDYMGIPNTSAMNLTLIPTDGRAADPHFTMDMYQTRIKLASTLQTKRLGEISSFIETDFYGNGGGGLRLRHAFITFKNVRIGQTWSGFTDAESWPNITDFDGPATGAWVRQPQLAYFVRPQEDAEFLFSIETPFQDYSRYLSLDTLLQAGNQTTPDVTAHYAKRFGSRHHIQIGTVLRYIKYKTQSDDIQYVPGFGFNFSGHNTFFKRDKFIWQLIWGKGIARYLVSFGGGGWDAAPNGSGDLLALGVYGGYISYQHYWSESLSSTLVYGLSQVDNPLDIPYKNIFNGAYFSGNMYWQPVGPLNFALEFLYGDHHDEFNKFGNNYRLQFVFEYNF